MDQPNAIYFQLFANAVVVVIGALLLAGSIKKGPYKSTDVIPNWVKGVIGIPCVIFGLIVLYRHLGEILGV